MVPTPAPAMAQVAAGLYSLLRVTNTVGLAVPAELQDIMTLLTGRVGILVTSTGGAPSFNLRALLGSKLPATEALSVVLEPLGLDLLDEWEDWISQVSRTHDIPATAIRWTALLEPDWSDGPDEVLLAAV